MPLVPPDLISYQALPLYIMLQAYRVTRDFPYVPVASCSFQLRSYLYLCVECPSCCHYYPVGKYQIIFEQVFRSHLWESSLDSWTASLTALRVLMHLHICLNYWTLSFLRESLPYYLCTLVLCGSDRPRLFTLPMCQRVTTRRNLGSWKINGRHSRALGW